MIDLKSLDEKDARLIQLGLHAVGLYRGTTQGRPGPKTLAAYRKYSENLAATAADLGDAIATVAEGEIGVREQPKNSNSGKRVREYQAATWLDGTGWPWCAAFVDWCVREAGQQVSLPWERPRTAGAWDLANWARKVGLPVVDPDDDAKIRRGDIVIYEFSHVGIATASASRGNVDVVEGNTDASGSREGGGVYAKRRSLSIVREYIRIDGR